MRKRSQGRSYSDQGVSPLEHGGVEQSRIYISSVFIHFYVLLCSGAVSSFKRKQRKIVVGVILIKP